MSVYFDRLRFNSCDFSVSVGGDLFLEKRPAGADVLWFLLFLNKFCGFLDELVFLHKFGCFLVEFVLLNKFRCLLEEFVRVFQSFTHLGDWLCQNEWLSEADLVSLLDQSLCRGWVGLPDEDDS